MALNLVQVVAAKTDALRLLEAAYETRLGIDGDRAIVLDSMLETARSNGFCGSAELAAGILRMSSRFHIKKSPVGKWQAVRQSMALVPVPDAARRTALVPVENGPRSRALVPI